MIIVSNDEESERKRAAEVKDYRGGKLLGSNSEIEARLLII